MRYLFLLAVVLVSCDSLKWDGYSQSKSGMYYKVHRLGDGERKAEPGDFVYAQIAVYDAENRLLFQNGMKTGSVLQISIGTKKDRSFSEALSLLHQGDSASFMNMKINNLNQISNGELSDWDSAYRLDLKLNRISGESDEEQPLEDLELLELQQLKNYLDKPDQKDLHEVQGVYLEVLERGEGQLVQSGQNVSLHYVGYYLNQQQFDNTYTRNLTLDFQLGKPDQVIKAFEIALHQVGNGGKIRVVTPSNKAFGEKGSSSGIIPPFTSLEYIIEVAAVN